MKKGFFDSKTTNRPGGAKLVELKGCKRDPSGTKAIPDFLRVQPDEQEQRYAQMRTQLVEALKPNQETVSQIAQDPTLLAGT